jgi:hypothetical protein
MTTSKTLRKARVRETGKSVDLAKIHTGGFSAIAEFRVETCKSLRVHNRIRRFQTRPQSVMTDSVVLFCEILCFLIDAPIYSMIQAIQL